MDSWLDEGARTAHKLKIEGAIWAFDRASARAEAQAKVKFMNCLKDTVLCVEQAYIHDTPSTDSKEKLPIREVIIRKNQSSPGTLHKEGPDLINESDHIIHI